MISDSNSKIRGASITNKSFNQYICTSILIKDDGF